MPPDALFWIASMSKSITATALMMLVDEGKVKVDDPVEKYLPEFKGEWLRGEKDATHEPLIKPKHPILVRNILSHTSGLAFRSAVEQPTLDAAPAADGSAELHARSRCSLSRIRSINTRNEGLNTAGRIIEVVERHALRDLPAEAALRSARHEGHHLLAERGADETAGQILQAHRR